MNSLGHPYIKSCFLSEWAQKGRLELFFSYFHFFFFFTSHPVRSSLYKNEIRKTKETSRPPDWHRLTPPGQQETLL